MRAALYIRIAAILQLIQAALHTIGGVFGAPPPGPGAAAFAIMRANHFAVYGVVRSYAIFYRGFGLAITISMVVEALLLWILASWTQHRSIDVRPLLIVFIGGYVAHCVNALTFFFFAPVLGEVLIALCLLAAILSPRRIVSATA